MAESLCQDGVDRWHVDQEIERFLSERAAAIRAKGIREICMGGGIMSVGAAPILGFYLAGSIPVRFASLCFAAVLYGVYRLLRGIDVAVTGRMKGSLS